MAKNEFVKTENRNHVLREIQNQIWNLEFDEILTMDEAIKITSILQKEKVNLCGFNENTSKGKYEKSNPCFNWI